jgi:hypothetical protein
VTWFYVDDQISDHKKITRLPRGQRAEAMGLWLLAGAWAKRHKTDGFVPEHEVGEHDGTPEIAEALVKVGLWHRHEIDGEPGYVYHDWSEWQKTREQEEAGRPVRRG